ncbi:MAG: hypothetical protein K0R24_2016, partial [Gammaproteobacteria bacterium]|nr:hypothetical protein [Gammaproteobacteria bacterium]
MPFYPPNLEEFLQEYIPENFGSDFIFNRLKPFLREQFSPGDKETFENNWASWHEQVFKSAIQTLVREVILKIGERHPWLILSSKDSQSYFLEIDIFLKK